MVYQHVSRATLCALQGTNLFFRQVQHRRLLLCSFMQQRCMCKATTGKPFSYSVSLPTRFHRIIVWDVVWTISSTEVTRWQQSFSLKQDTNWSCQQMKLQHSSYGKLPLSMWMATVWEQWPTTYLGTTVFFGITICQFLWCKSQRINTRGFEPWWTASSIPEHQFCRQCLLKFNRTASEGPTPTTWTWISNAISWQQNQRASQRQQEYPGAGQRLDQHECFCGCIQHIPFRSTRWRWWAPDGGIYQSTRMNEWTPSNNWWDWHQNNSLGWNCNIHGFNALNQQRWAQQGSQQLRVPTDSVYTNTVRQHSSVNALVV